MKKLISLFLTVLMIASCFAVTTLTVGAADITTVFDYGFSSSETVPKGFTVYNIHYIAEGIGGNNSSVGYYDGADETATSSKPNRFDASGFKAANNSTGLWVFETDIYIPSNGIPTDDKIQILTGAVSGSWISYHTTLLQPGSTTAQLGTVPQQDWFKLRFEFNYLPDGTANDTLTVYSIVSNRYKTKVGSFSISDENWAANGFNRIRISVGKSKVYFDNMKYYQELTSEKSQYEISNESAVHYSEAFDAGMLYNLTSLTQGTTYGNFKSRYSRSATFETATDPVDATNKVLHIKTTTDDAWSEYQSTDIRTAGSFEKKSTGTQIFEIKYYIPSTGKNSELASDKYNSAAITLALFCDAPSGGTGYEVSFWGGRVAQMRLGRHSSFSYSPTTSSYTTYGSSVLNDSWITARFIINYNNGVIEYQIEENNVTRTIGTCAMPAALKAYPVAGVLFGASEANVEYYIDDMIYYEVDNIPFEIDFDRNVSVISPDYTVTSGSIAPAPNGNNGNSLKITAVAVEAGDDVAQQLINFDTRLYPIGVKDGIVQMDASFYIAKGFVGENERIVLIPNTDNLTTIDASAVGAAINPNSGALASNTAQIWSDGIIIKNSTNKISYPKNEWFKIRCTYNINTNLVQYHLVEADGTTTFVGEAVETGNFAAYAKNTGVKRLRIQYYKPAKLELPEDVEFYIDNIKFSNATWGDIALADNGTYTASVDYSAQGEVVTNTKLMVMQYNAANELVAINIYTPTFADGNGVYKVENIAKAAGATSAKLAYWDSLSGATPLAVATN